MAACCKDVALLACWQRPLLHCALPVSAVLLLLPLLLLQAAQWRKDHRSDAFKARQLIVWEVDEAEPWEGEALAGPG